MKERYTVFLDEILVQKEMERTRRNNGQRLEEIKEEILKKEREQKIIPEFITEIRNGIVTIEGKDYRCERKVVLDGAASIIIFPDDVEQIIENKPAAHIQYRTLLIGENIFYIQAPIVIKDEQEYQQNLKELLQKEHVTYQPIDTGNFMAGSQKVCYVTGITANIAGMLFTINYFYMDKSGFTSGNFTCKLLDRFTFENFFLAKLYLMGEKC